MNHFRSLSDTAAVALSVLCTLHCLVLPLILVWLPTAMAITVANEAFHFFMVLIVIPLSLFALFFGCKEHKRYRVVILGLIGLFFLLTAVFLGHDNLGESGEKLLTVLGSVFIAMGHLSNYYLCKHTESCRCNSSK